MQRQIRRVGLTLLVAFIAVFAQLNYVQIFAAHDIAGHDANIRRLLAEYSIKRGDIVTLDGVTVARSRETGGRLKYRRLYPGGELYGHVTGYYSLVYGTDRIERTFTDELLGERTVITMQDVQDRLFGEGRQGDDVRLTIHSALQEVARSALGSQRGAVVAIDPGTGEVRAMWSNPSFDPGPLGAHQPRRMRNYWESLDPGSPQSGLVNRATSRGYPPGSSFKMIVAAAALESGRFTPSSTFDDPGALELPLTTATIRNFAGGTCAGGGRINLTDAFRVSCNTTFGDIGLRIPRPILRTAERFGFNERIPFDIADEASVFPDIPDDRAPARAQAAIGQVDVVATPLQMAVATAAVANGGRVARPRLVREVIDASGGIVRRYAPEGLGRAISQQTAAQLRRLMVEVVERGTATAAQIEGIQVAGKTGTAQTGVEGAAPHAWFVGFAPANDPMLAIAVIVENGGSLGSEATGGRVAAPIARAVLLEDRRIRRW